MEFKHSKIIKKALETKKGRDLVAKAKEDGVTKRTLYNWISKGSTPNSHKEEVERNSLVFGMSLKECRQKLDMSVNMVSKLIEIETGMPIHPRTIEYNEKRTRTIIKSNDKSKVLAEFYRKRLEIFQNRFK